MDRDQYRMRDPRWQYAGPEEQGAEQQSAPGSTGRLGKDADHGEQSYRGSNRLDGRKAVITGGDSGIGRAVALAFAREGADLLLSHLPDEQADAQQTVDLVREAGRTALSAPGDVRDQDYCQGLIDQAVGELGGLDIVVNNAAYQMAQPGGIVDIDDEQFDQVMRTNLYATFWLCRAAAPHLPPGGTIINVTSIQAHDSSPALLDYATTKAGIIAFTKALAGDLIRRGVRVMVTVIGLASVRTHDPFASTGEGVISRCHRCSPGCSHARARSTTASGLLRVSITGDEAIADAHYLRVVRVQAQVGVRDVLGRGVELDLGPHGEQLGEERQVQRLAQGQRQVARVVYASVDRGVRVLVGLDVIL
jgi:NAD(P)-dependent dehydrogenase (short-subunit alcohol dehydrogenase family)